VTRIRSRQSWTVTLVVAATVVAGCSADDDDGESGTVRSAASPVAESSAVQRYPDIVDAAATSIDGEWRFDVTVSSPYDSPERYADAWRIVGPDGTIYGVRELAHDHASEQPFTRSLGGVSIPDDVADVTIEGRDRRYGWGGATIVVALPR